ncbi:hypothetical protein Tco_1444488 [Tanacetum coccineum]
MYGYSYSDSVKFRWLTKAIKDSHNEPPLIAYQHWKNAIYEEALRKSEQMHQTFKKSSLTMTHKLDDMIKLPKSQPKRTYMEDLECEMVMVKMHRCMSWLGSTDAYDELIDSLERFRETLGTPMEVEPLDHTKLKDVGMDTFNHDIPLSSKEVPSFNEPEPQPQPLPSCPSLDECLGEERGHDPQTKPHSPDSLKMKVVDHLTIHTPPSPYVAPLHHKDIYCYYHPCMVDPKKYYRFKLGLLGQSRSLGVDFSNLEVIENNFLRGLSLPIKPNELGNVGL